jgi:uncharacterized protein (TIGR02284 family)
MKNANDKEIQQLNSFLRGECSAVETYDQVIDRAKDPMLLQVLRENRESHTRRKELLRQKIRTLGGNPSESSGAWGTLVKAIEGGAKMFGTSSAVAVLEEGEDHGLEDYRRDLHDLSMPTRQFVAGLLQEQQTTHDKLSRLKHAMD